MFKPVNNHVQAGQLNHFSSLSTGTNNLCVFTCIFYNVNNETMPAEITNLNFSMVFVYSTKMCSVVGSEQMQYRRVSRSFLRKFVPAYNTWQRCCLGDG